jgi:hypothetical protein
MASGFGRSIRTRFAAPPTEFPNVAADRAGLVLDHRKNHATHSGCTDLREFEAWVLAKELAGARNSTGNTTLNSNEDA